MKTTNLDTTMKNWSISYNPYTDIFQIYSNFAFSISNSRLNSFKSGDMIVFLDKKSEAPLLIEFQKAYSHFGNIDNMSKQDIIKKVTGYLTNYA